MADSTDGICAICPSVWTIVLASITDWGSPEKLMWFTPCPTFLGVIYVIFLQTVTPFLWQVLGQDVQVSTAIIDSTKSPRLPKTECASPQMVQSGKSGHPHNCLPQVFNTATELGLDWYVHMYLLCSSSVLQQILDCYFSCATDALFSCVHLQLVIPYQTCN